MGCEIYQLNYLSINFTKGAGGSRKTCQHIIIAVPLDFPLDEAIKLFEIKNPKVKVQQANKVVQ